VLARWLRPTLLLLLLLLKDASMPAIVPHNVLEEARGLCRNRSTAGLQMALENCDPACDVGHASSYPADDCCLAIDARPDRRLHVADTRTLPVARTS